MTNITNTNIMTNILINIYQLKDNMILIRLIPLMNDLLEFILICIKE